MGFAMYEFIVIMKYSAGGSTPSIVVAGLLYYILTSWKTGGK